MTFRGSRHFYLHGPIFPLKKKSQITLIFYECVNIKTNIKEELYSFIFLFDSEDK